MVVQSAHVVETMLDASENTIHGILDVFSRKAHIGRLSGLCRELLGATQTHHIAPAHQTNAFHFKLDRQNLVLEPVVPRIVDNVVDLDTRLPQRSDAEKNAGDFCHLEPGRREMAHKVGLEMRSNVRKAA